MPRFTKSVRVPYTSEQCFALVSDIARYPEFIRWITAMRVSGEAEPAPGVRECIGDAVVSFKGFIERFSTRVRADATNLRVSASLVSGPFRKLDAHWRIVPLDRGGADITLDIDYAFRNALLSWLASANHDLAVNRIMDAFLTEAARRFAAPASASAPG